MTTREQILHLLEQDIEGLTPKNIQAATKVSKQRIHRLLKELLESGLITKYGTSPKVIYRKAPHQQDKEVPKLSNHAILDDYILISPMGKLLTGSEAFISWCERRKLPLQKTLEEYISTCKKYEKYKGEKGLIDGTLKLRNTQELNLCVDLQYYADFYAIERFGKTTLGQLLHFGKMSQSRKLISMIVEKTSEQLNHIIKKHNIEAVGYIPPTLFRELQIMNELKRLYNISLPVLQLEKIKGEIIVPQKALSKIKDRILNAQVSIRVAEERSFKNILLIDDALGSGATINETACKIKRKGIAKKVYGFAITGSYKGFEVISEA